MRSLCVVGELRDKIHPHPHTNVYTCTHPQTNTQYTLQCKKSCQYLIVTIICEYKILRFWEWDDFAGTNFCDFMKSRAKSCNFAQAKVKSSTLKSIGFSKCGSV